MRENIKRIISLITSAVFITANAEIPLFVQATDFKGFDIKALSPAASDYINLSDISYGPFDLQSEISSFQMMNLIMPVDLSFDDQYDGEFISTKTINSISELVELSKQHPASYQNAEIIFAVTSSNNDTQGFYGLGSEEYPFNGKITVAGGTRVSLTMYRALFNCIYDSADISSCSFDFVRGAEDIEAALFAETVKHGEGCTGTWNVIISNGKDEQTGEDTSYSFSGVIGKIYNDSEIKLSVTDNSESDIRNSGNSGFFCNEMMENSKLTVSYNEKTGTYNVTSENGSAGSAAGIMNSGSELVISSDYSFSGSISGVNAGGIVGYAQDAKIIFTGSTQLSDADISASSGSAGGIAGKIICSSEIEFELSNYSSENVSVIGNDAGGVFGYAENNSAVGESMTISSSVNSNISSVCSSNIKATNYGGIIGRYSSSVLSDSLVISGLTSHVSQTGNTTITNFGGIIGKLSGSKGSYAKITDTEVISDNNANCTNFGGIIADSDSSGHFNDYQNIKVSGGYSKTTKAGGLIGFLEAGVLRLSGITDMTDSVVKPADNIGQLVGNRGYALIYALGSGNDSSWTFNRCGSVRVDDVGNWGEVVRLVDGYDIESAGIIDADMDNHKITVDSFTVDNKTKIVEINSENDFVKLALNMQLYSNLKPVLSFSVSNRMNSGYTINVNTNIDLSETGIISLTRDDSNAKYSITVNGNDHTIYLAAGEAYGMRDNENLTDNTLDGNGKLYRHDYIGLISYSQTSIVFSSLHIGGNIYVGPDKSGDNNLMYIGGCIGRNDNGKITLNNVYAEENIYIDSTVTKTNVSYYVGGLIGYVNKADILDITDSCFSSESVISNKDCERCFIGGIIGGADTLTICNITDTVLSGKIYVGSPELSIPKGMAGGLISFIKNLNNNDISRTLNLNNISVDDLEMKIYSSEESGGMLGYKWFNSNVYFKTDSDHGVDVNGCNIFTSAKSIGGLVYLATGYWQVNDIEYNEAYIDISSAENFGMMVNKAYLSESSGALYIELTDTRSYNIASSRKVRLTYSNLINFDEIAAYTILNNNTHSNGENGVVSIPAVDNEDNRYVIMDGELCNTYKNKTIIPIENSNTRYYYNLDEMRSKNSAGTLNDSEKFMMWSLSKYACPNITNFFNVDNYNSISGNIDLKGYSYYPIDVPASEKSTNNDTLINNAVFSFCFKEIKSGEENDYSDNIDRTPDSSSSQHYMMHYGIFKNLKNPSRGGYDTLNIKGNNSVSGSIGHDTKYSGVLLCGTAEGKYDLSVPGYASVNFDESTVFELKDLYICGYKSGYSPLLINNIGSYSNCVFSGIRTSSAKTVYYMDRQIYAASSLIGKIGSDTSSSIAVIFNRMVLDSRTYYTNLPESVNLKLNEVYSTASCIFSNAVFMESFQYSDVTGSTGSYNFKYDEDWGDDEPRNVTYGYEISKSVEYYGEQMNYFKDGSKLTSPVDKSASAEYDFSNFMPYVYQSPAKGVNQNYHELKVNIYYGDLNEGCGTYGDPYIIKDFKQISLISRIIDSGVVPAGSQVNFNLDTSKFCCPSSHSDNHKECDINSDIGNYLRKAYYVFDNENHYIEIPASFKGLGDKDDTTTNTFMGVIVGRNGMKLKMNGSNPLIKISAGSVVKDIEIEYTNDITIAQENSVSATKDLTFKPGCQWGTKTILTNGKGGSYFGGVIGQIIGGDNILDNVKVKFDKTLSLGTGKYDHLIPVGGYVGVVRNGGLIFRNMANYSGLKNEICDKINNSDYFYVNPILGRVLDAYAVYMDKYENKPNVEPKINNGNKNYVISSLTDPFKYKITNKISVKANDDATYVVAGTQDGTSKGWSRVSIPDSESLFIFSLLISSGATAMEPKTGNDPTQESGVSFGAEWIGDNLWYSEGTSYAIGRTHLAQYTDVGKTDDPSNADFITSCEDMNNTNRVILDTNDKFIIPFLVRYYTEKMYSETVYNSAVPSVTASWPARLLTGSSMRYSVEMTCESQDIYLPDGFRGINSLFGSSYSTNYDRICIAMFGFDGNDNHFYINHEVRLYEEDNYPLLDNSMNTITGVGFFNRVISNSNSNTADTEGSKMYKKMPWEYRFDDPDNPKQKYAICDMSLSGKVLLYIYNFNTKKRNLNYKNSRAGGVAGSTETGNGNSERHIYFDSIKLDGLDVSGAYYTGGLIGYVGDKVNNKATTYNLCIKNISSDNLTVSGGTHAGGLAGKIENCDNNVWIDGENCEFKIKNICASAVAGADSYAGGLVGYLNKAAEIRNVTVTRSNEEINIISEDFSGGIVGYANNALTIRNCSSKQLTLFAANNVSSKERYSGGMIGKANNTLTIDNGEVADCHIIAGFDANNTNSNNVGCVTGFSNNVVSVNNTMVTGNECRVNVKLKSGTSKVGYLFGGCNNSYNVAGYNLYSSNNYFTCENAPGTLNRGNLIGNAGENKVKLYSVSKQGSDLVKNDIGNRDDTKSIIVYADYKGVTSNTEAFDTSETAYSPYVNINPKVKLENLQLTGDGVASFGGILNSEKIMSDSIEDSNTNLKKYSSANIKKYSSMFYENGGIYYNNYTKYQTVEKDTDSDKKIPEMDFPVILVDTNDSQQITDMINTYISVLTNEDQLGQGKQLYSNIGVTTYRWNDKSSGFTALSEKEKSIVYRNNKLYMSIGKYDNERKQFTLLDVQYNDPSGNDGVVYHLYIPVMVKRLLQFSFDSRVRSGTDYNYADYLDTNRFVIENHGSSVTTAITYSYVRSVAEWQESLNSGEDLFWNFDKEIYLRSEDKNSALPYGSELILTDRSRTEMKYTIPGRTNTYNTYWLKTAEDTFENAGSGDNQNILDFTKMKSINGGYDFSELTLAEILLNQAEVNARKDAEGNLVIAGSASDATAAAVYTENGTRSVILLRPFSSDSDSEDIQRYSVTVNSDVRNFALKEVYYLTVRDSEENNEFVKNFVSFMPNSLKNPTDKPGLPTHKISGDDDVCSYVLGNFFDQSVEVTTNNSTDIINSDDSASVDSTYTSTISFKDQENKSLFISYSDKLDLYQKFDISLRKVNENGSESAENICGRTLVSSEYNLTQLSGSSKVLNSFSTEKQTLQVPETSGNYSLVYPGSIKEYMKTDDVMKISVEASVYFSYPDEQLIMEQFPARTSNEYKDGIIYCGRSALAYNKSDLENSTICSDIQKDIIDIHYYRSSAVGVRFTYNAYGDTNNPLGVYSQLGKNPSDTNEEYNIKGAGVYNPSILGEEINKADKIKVSLKLYQKNNDGVYTEIQNSQISDYIRNTDITFNGQTQRFDGTNGYSYEFDLPERPGDLDEFPLISTSFDVNSGSEFENKGLMYSNYKVDISVELYYSNETPVPNSSASDYIIFTNARIYNKLINAG